MSLREAKILSWDLTTTTSTATGATAGGPGPGLKCVAFVAIADGGNSANVKFGGGGTATVPLAKNASAGIGLPEGYFINPNELSVDGGGTAGLIVHVLCAVASDDG